MRALEWADEEAVPTLDGMSPGWKAPAVEVRALADDLVEIRVGDVTLELSRGEARLLVAELKKILP